MSQDVEEYSDDSVSAGYCDNDESGLPSNDDDSLAVGNQNQKDEVSEKTRMEAAIRACNSGVPLTRAARQFGVARATLFYKLRGEHSGVRGAQSRKFSDSEEDHFAEVLVNMAKIGVPLDKAIFRKVVEIAAIKKGFAKEKANMSSAWHRLFLRRHPEIHLRSTKGKHPREVKNGKIRKWTVERCTKWVTTLSELHAYGYLSDSRGLFSLDECVFMLPENTENACTPRSEEEDLSLVDGAHQGMVTALFCGRADGLVLRPLLIFPDVQHLPSQIAGTADRCYIASTESGGMDPETFADYVRAEVFPNLQAQKNVIFVGGHFSYLNNLEFLLECAASDKDIKVVRFPVRLLTQLLPVDVRAFEPVEERCRDYLCSAAVDHEQSFALQLVETLPQFNLENSLISEFRQAGIFPFEPSEICKSLDAKETAPERTAPSAEELFSRQFAAVEENLNAICTLAPADVQEAMELLRTKVAASVSTEHVAETTANVEDVLLVSPKRPPKNTSKRTRKAVEETGGSQKKKRLRR
ncbi:uncharacterized protein LOC129585562 [Paramacrobiotus metropolitanus]|uniref:uncharacterized protein LOC129585562 n=1 Tax=Paramacrobiotus metropolitanus TaxID=2943436 RepID=UPI002445B9C9|nr:uncharacterized protein LOC129585562 [Paramacrobiotus metropolitanus]